MYDASWSLRVQINKEMLMEDATYNMQSPKKGEGMEIWALLQSKQVKRTPQDSVNELIIWKTNPLVVPVTSVKFKSELLHA